MKLTRRLHPRAELKINTYVIISRAVEDGIHRGWNRAFKYAESPSSDTIKSEIEKEVLNSLTEVISWSED
jgi:hypothetical protein